MSKRNTERGSATAELVVALPIVITLALTGIKFVGVTIENERLHYLAEGIVQAVMRDETDFAIRRELNRSAPGATFSLHEESSGEFTVTLGYRSASATATGFR